MPPLDFKEAPDFLVEGREEGQAGPALAKGLPGGAAPTGDRPGAGGGLEWAGGGEGAG